VTGSAGSVDRYDVEVLTAQVAAARATFHRGRPAEAIGEYQALRRRLARARVARPELTDPYVRVLIGLAVSQFEVSGRLARPLRLLDRAGQVVDADGSPDLVATVHGQRGVLLLRAGRHRAALAALDAAVSLIDGAARFDQMMMLLNRGVANLEGGALEAASADFERCAAIAAEADERELEMRATHNLGYAEFLRGRLPRALAEMTRAEELVEHPISMLDRARVLREAGLTRDAQELLARAEQLFDAGGLEQDLAEAQLARAECALVERDPARALELAASAERRFARRGNALWQRRACLLVLRCESRAARGDRPEARRLQRLARDAARLADACRAEKRSDLARSADLLASECRLRAGDAVSSPASPPLPRLQTGQSLESRLQTREVRALAARRRGDPVTAAAEVRRGLTELGSYQGGFGSLDLRTAAAVYGEPLARLGLDLASDTGSPAAFLAAVERGRAFSSRLTAVGPPHDERTAGLLAELRQTRERLRALTGDPDAAAEVTRLQARAGRLERDIRARAWQQEAGGEPTAAAPAVAADLRVAAREAGTVFVSYVFHRGRWWAVRVSGGRPRLFDLADTGSVDELVRRVRADLDALALPSLPPPLADAVRGSLQAGLLRLDELLLRPLRVDGSPLVLSAGGGLGVLPWSLLPSRRGRPVVVTPSATAWLHARSAARPTVARVVSVAGPGLHRAEREAAEVSRTWPDAELLTGEAATAGAVAAALEQADVVHVAGHGNHQQDSPLFSCLRLADGPLFAYELDAGEGSAACVVLSACEAGLATVRPGDEGLGLTSVLLHLGSSSVLAGVARVRDEVAASVMLRVHRSISMGTDSAQALAGAIAAEDEPAPFVCFGAAW
jgi:tetratricopeptide (TPR) repeat protein